MIADLLYGIPILAQNRGQNDRSMERFLATFFIIVSCFLTLMLHNALNTFLCILIVFPMLWLCFSIPYFNK